MALMAKFKEARVVMSRILWVDANIGIEKTWMRGLEGEIHLSQGVILAANKSILPGTGTNSCANIV